MEFKVGDRVKIRYAGSQFWATGKFGTVIPNDFDKYDYRVKVDNDNRTPIGVLELYFYKEDLEKI